MFVLIAKEFYEYNFNIKTFNFFDNRFINEIIKKEKNIVKNLYEQNIKLLNKEQKHLFNKITTALSKKNVLRILIEGSAGSDKTFLFKTITYWAENNGLKYKCFTPTGLASLFYNNSSTIHSGFLLPLDQYENMQSHMNIHSPEAIELLKCNFFLFDEISLMSKYMFDAIDCLLKNICRNELPFGGKKIILGGDFKQLACVLNYSTEYSIFLACIKNSLNFSKFAKHFLTINQRQDNADFSNFLLKIGLGKLNINNTILVKISKAFFVKGSIIDVIFDKIETNFYNNIILSTTNECVEKINRMVLDLNENKTIEYFSCDFLNEKNSGFSNEFLNTLTPSGFPNHHLYFKIGAPIVILKNLCPAKGVVNGTRGLVKKLEKNYIVFSYYNKNGVLDSYVLHKVNFTVANASKCTIKFTRNQFPCKLAYCLTIHKAQ